MNKKIVLLAAATLSATPAAFADRASEIEATLKAFQANPVQVMSQVPAKKNPKGKAKSLFKAADIRSGSFVSKKKEKRPNLCMTVNGGRVCLNDNLSGRAAYQANDLAENLVDSPRDMLRTLEEMEQKNVLKAQLAESPWSDSYWPIYQGVIAQRYVAKGFPHDEDWSLNEKFVNDNSLDEILTKNSSSVDDLSPAEKYDLLVGDPHQSLTNEMWNQGRDYFNGPKHKVETWMGICHGWAPASYMVPRPAKAISMVAADGHTKINFYPSDIKALASLLWATSAPQTRFIGGRCNSESPKTSPNGRVRDGDCFDTNPGTWHLSVVNQISGVRKARKIDGRSLVIDATFDYEVWNQPVFGYSYTYFNPQTGKAATSLADARVSLADFSTDKFKKTRAKNAVAVVGIAMDLTYIQETEPSHAKTDSAASDSPTTVQYLYDVELDRDGKIVGGEWYTNLHPDFLWTPELRARAETTGDSQIRSRWNGDGPIPSDWQGPAIETSRQDGTPLASIVEALVAKTLR